MTNININLNNRDTDTQQQEQEQEILNELQADIKEMKALLDSMNDSIVKTNYKAIVDSVLSDEQAKSSVYIDDDEEITFNYYSNGELIKTARGYQCKDCGATVEVDEDEEIYFCDRCVADV